MQGNFYITPLDSAQMETAAEELLLRYPFTEREVIGTSVLGKPIYSFTLGARECERVLYVGTVHGMEWLTGLLLLRFLEEVCQSLDCGTLMAEMDVTRMLSRRSLTVIPMVNPDGADIALRGASAAGIYRSLVECYCEGSPCRWQANARGVDLNHNFDAGFAQVQQLEYEAGIFHPGPTRHGGNYPNSEPETRALVDFCEKVRPGLMMAFHSQGEEIYYDYPPYTPKESYLFSCILAKLSGYKVCNPDKTASHGGFKDWFLKRFRKPAFTLEIGRGKNPLPISELEPIYARLTETMLAGLLL